MQLYKMSKETIKVIHKEIQAKDFNDALEQLKEWNHEKTPDDEVWIDAYVEFLGDESKQELS